MTDTTAPTNIEPLAGHTSPDTAYVVADYPYGFKLRCQIRYWIETKPGHGQRCCSQTTNPKRGHIWNTPKASTYSALRVLYRDGATGHIENAALTFYADVAEIDTFARTYAAALTSDHDQKTLRVLRALAVKHAEKYAPRPTVQS